ncbi:hypothetical protein [Peterkaempfera bronchialis]|uniref:hypothetical protein n=1 Tax=Peterkaempfera bronchialis TaxID=2126346 RepID=UPI003C2CB905
MNQLTRRGLLAGAGGLALTALPAVRAGHAYPISWNDVCSYRWAQRALRDFESRLKQYAA